MKIAEEVCVLLRRQLWTMTTTMQQTIRSEIHFSGIGLHSGKNVHLTIQPAPADHGIVFHVIQDGRRRAVIPAVAAHTGALAYNTSLQGDGIQIQTVEHLLSALHGYGVDNAIISIDSTEIPILDGSATAIVYLLAEAGLDVQTTPRNRHRLMKSVRIGDSSAWIEASPVSGNTLVVDYSIDFPHPAIGAMRMEYRHDALNYVHALSPARTFGFLREVEYLQKQGLIRGATLDNAIVLDDTRIISGDLRFPNEFVRHKILDFIGDISLLGFHLIAQVRAHKAGHKLHAQLVQSLLASPECFVPAQEDEPASEIIYMPFGQEALVG